MDMRTITMASMLFASGISAGHAAQQAGPSDYRGKDDREAALALGVSLKTVQNKVARYRREGYLP